MKFLTTVLPVMALLWPAVRAINMTFYKPQCGVEYAFGPFYEELLLQAETPTSTTEFTDFFTVNGSMIVTNSTSQGADDILALRQALLPADGSVRWNHFPNITFVAEDTYSTKTYQLSGILHIIEAGNCSTTYFSTRFTVTKNAMSKIPNLQPRSGSLVTYDGFRVEGSLDPCFASY